MDAQGFQSVRVTKSWQLFWAHSYDSGTRCGFRHKMRIDQKNNIYISDRSRHHRIGTRRVHHTSLIAPSDIAAICSHILRPLVCTRTCVRVRTWQCPRQAM